MISNRTISLCLLALVVRMPSLQGFTTSTSISTSRPISDDYRWSYAPSSLCAQIQIEGLVDSYERLSQVDCTIRALQKELPITLTRPLTGVSAAQIYSSNFKLVVAISGDSNNESDITLCKSRNELINLSEVLVLGTTATQQASNAFLAAAARATSSAAANPQDSPSASTVSSQLIVDSKFETIRIPWKTKVSPFGSAISAAANVEVEGISELEFDENSKIKTHRIIKVIWNGSTVNGPTVGQALRRLQGTMNQFQQSPLFNLLPGGSQVSAGLLKDIRDGLMERAISTADRQDSKRNESLPPIVVVPAHTNDTEDLLTNFDSAPNVTFTSSMPIPGTKSWEQYKLSHDALSTFCKDVIPLLSGDTSGSVPLQTYFAKNVSFLSNDGAELLVGSERVANYYESLALARKGTRGTWVPQSVLVDWKNCTATVSYSAGTVPTWTITGKDMYELCCKSTNMPSAPTLPIVTKIKQVELSIQNQDGSVRVNDKLLMQNLISTLERGRSLRDSSIFGPDVLSGLLKQANGGVVKSTPVSKDKAKKLSQQAAAKVYYIMSDLHQQLEEVLTVPDSTSILDIRVQPPAIEYVTNDIELKGYLDQTIVRGPTRYQQAVGGTLTQLRRAISRGDVLLDSKKRSTSSVELTKEGSVRVKFCLDLKIPPFGKSLIPANTVPSAPLNLELISEYKIDPESGSIYQHQILESRINGQLAPGDTIVRTFKNFRDPSSSTTQENGNDTMMKSVSDMMGWIQSMRKG